MAIMTYEQFYELTYDRFNRRGTELTAIDEALNAYQVRHTREGVRRIQVAFNTWVQVQGGADWTKHTRNSKKGFTKLNGQLSDFLSDRPVDFTAMRNVHASRRGALKRILGGQKKLVVKRSTQLLTGKAVTTAILDTKKAVNALGAAPVRHAVQSSVAEEAVHSMLKGLFNTEIIAEIQGELMQGFIREMVTAVTPFLGHIKSGVKAFGYAGLAARDAYRQSTVRDQAQQVLSGDPQAAVEAILEILERAKNQHLTSAAISATEFVARCGATLADGGVASGAVIGAASAMAKLVQNVYVVGRDYNEKQKANVILASDAELTSTIFKVNPLLGAYYIAFGEAQDLVNLVGNEVGTRDWQEFIEFGHDRWIKPLKERARAVIFDARFEVEGLEVQGTGLIDGTKQNLMNAVGIRS